MVVALKRLALACLLALAATGAQAADHLAMRLVSDSPTVPAGGQVWVGIEQTPAPGWHSYWRNPGDTGLAPEVTWSLPQGVTAGELQYPAPERLAYPDIVTFGYTRPVTLVAQFRMPAGTRAGDVLPLKAHVSTVVCADICEPVQADLSRTLRVGPATGGALAGAVAALPRSLAVRVTTKEGDGLRLTLTPPADDPEARRDFSSASGAWLFNENDQLWKPSAPQTMVRSGESRVVTIGQNVAWPKAPGHAVLAFANGRAYRFDLAPAPASGVSWSLIVVMGLAFAGGLVLNLMPCVFPVLSMKLMAVTRAGHDHRLARREALAYAGGVMVSFLLLAMALEAVRAMGGAVGWGFQLQSPVVTAALSMVLLLAGLNLSGAFEIGAGLQAMGGEAAARSHGRMPPLLGAVSTGVLAVVVAAPCTAPFMATAVGVAVAQGGLAAWLIFLALGAGFASPFVVLVWGASFMPGVARWLPRPGKWMEVLRHILALPMYLAVAWMVWVFARQTNLTVGLVLSAALLILALGLLIRPLPAVWKGIAIGLAAGIAVTGTGMSLVQAPAAGAQESNRFSEARLADLRGQGQPILVDLTAAWCVTCKVNEALVLHDPRVTAAMARSHTAYLVGDWTRQDAAITHFLATFGRSGVPLYVYYAPGAEPHILPQILTVDDVLKTLHAR